MPSHAILRLGASQSIPTTENAPLAVSVDVASRDGLATSLQNLSKQEELDVIEIFVLSDLLSDLYDPLALSGVVPHLRPGGECRVTVSPPPTGHTTASPDWGIITTSFLLSGLKSEGEKRAADGTRTFVGRKCADADPSPSNGARKINLASSASASEEKKADEAIGSSNRVTIGDLDDDDDLIDEDRLLDDAEDDALAPPAVDPATRSAGDDCGGRKACDNCTCGRAEREAAGIKAEAPKKLTEVPTSSCGNCAKGDAFRCASCPFLGKPAFKPGEEHLVLDLADDL